MNEFETEILKELKEINQRLQSLQRIGYASGRASNPLLFEGYLYTMTESLQKNSDAEDSGK